MGSYTIKATEMTYSGTSGTSWSSSTEISDSDSYSNTKVFATLYQYVRFTFTRPEKIEGNIQSIEYSFKAYAGSSSSLSANTILFYCPNTTTNPAAGNAVAKNTVKLSPSLSFTKKQEATRTGEFSTDDISYLTKWLNNSSYPTYLYCLGGTNTLAIYPYAFTITITTEDEITTTPVTSVTISPSSLSLIVGETSQLTATVLPTDADDRTLSWSSSNTSVATVDEDGLVSAVGSGTATITAIAQDGSGVYGSCSVTVNEASTYIDATAISATATSITVGSTGTLSYSYSPLNANVKSLTYSLVNESDSVYLTLTSTGYMEAISVPSGSSIKIIEILATLINESGSVITQQGSVTVYSDKVTAISFTDNQASTIDVGEEVTISVKVGLYRAVNKNVDWIIEDSTIVEKTAETGGASDMTHTATFRGLKAGTTNIIVRAQDGSGVSATGSITVASNVIEVENITISPTSATMNVGDTLQMTVSITPSNATTQDIIWASTNTFFYNYMSMEDNVLTVTGYPDVSSNYIAIQLYAYSATNSSVKSNTCSVIINKPTTYNTYVCVSGSWKPAIAYVYNGSAWVQCSSVYIYDGGWHECSAT